MGKTAFLLLTTMLLASTTTAGTISVPAPVCTPSTRTQPDGIHLTAPDYPAIASPGDPALPFTEINVILPPDVIPASVAASLVGDRRSALPIDADIAPAPPMVTSANGSEHRDWGRGKHIDAGRNTLVYGNDDYYPPRNVQLASVGSMRQWRIATVRYYPFRYNPVSRRLEQTTGGRIELSYRDSAVSTPAISLGDDRAFTDRVKALTANYVQARSWYPASSRLSASQMDQPQPAADYVIITTSAIVAGSAKLQQFIDHKTSLGFSVEVETEAKWGGGAGDVAAARIRSFLQANYAGKGIRYVLLIGNPNPSTGDVPMKMLWPRSWASEYRDAPSDYFYADLTGNWDADGNGYFGEETSDFVPGGVDRFPEVIVGRIPFYGDFVALDSILQKTINYESGAVQGPWLRNVLLSMKAPDSSTPAYQLGEAIRGSAADPAGMTVTRAYDSDYGLSPPPEYAPCTYENVLSAWGKHAGFHFWWTHGNETVAADVISTGGCQYLDDTYPSFVFQASCLNGAPERTDNLGFALLKRGAIATVCASRVSWYATAFANTDSNAGMAYEYAIRLIRDHMPCGDAHYAMLLAIPNSIWMNHCVFNLYGDPSVAYPAAPVISHSPLADTDNTGAAYEVRAEISTTAPMASGNPVVKWNTTGGQDFSSLAMARTAGFAYTASIPAQPYGATVHYFIQATDIADKASVFPSDAPNTTLSFEVRKDTEAPAITHTPLGDTDNRFGPYTVIANVTDDLGLAGVTLHYSISGGPYIPANMTRAAGASYQADIPGPTRPNDTISYYITATDASLSSKQSRLPVGAASFSFRIVHKTCVAVLNAGRDTDPPYFAGGNLNAWPQITDIIRTDPGDRFVVSVLTSLKPDAGSVGLPSQDVLVLPDNGVPLDSLQSVSDWFQPGKVLLALDSAACYAAYTGWMWPGSVGTNGLSVYWEYGAGTNDQIILASDPITAGYSVGQRIGSIATDTQYCTDRLPPDAHVLAGRSGNPARCYAVYRDVPGRGRLVLLGPYMPTWWDAYPPQDQYSIIRNALIAPPQPRQLTITAPNGGESYPAGDTVKVSFTASGTWADDDLIKLEYCTGLDALWRPIPNAASVPYFAPFVWNTTGLPGSHGYRVRATLVGGAVSDDSDAPFSIIPTVDIPTAKSIPDGGIIRLAGKVVTSGLTGLAYVQEPDRRAGLRVASVQGLRAAAVVDLVGTMATVHGERVLSAETATALGTIARVGPYAIRTNALGGAESGLQGPVMEYRQVREAGHYTGKLLPTEGTSNIGLLVRVCGTVTASGPDWFYIDDGCRCNDGTGNIGVRVLCPGTTPPTTGQYLIINAISSTYVDSEHLFRALVLPDKADLLTFAP